VHAECNCAAGVPDDIGVDGVDSILSILDIITSLPSGAKLGASIAKGVRNLRALTRTRTVTKAIVNNVDVAAEGVVKGRLAVQGDHVQI
jgi:hypothetical protein